MADNPFKDVLKLVDKGIKQLNAISTLKKDFWKHIQELPTYNMAGTKYVLLEDLERLFKV